MAKPRTIALLGADLTNPNRGVAALSAAVVQNLLTLDPAADLFLFIGHRSSKAQPTLVAGNPRDIEVVNFRLSPHARWKDHLVANLLAAMVIRLVPAPALKRRLLERLERLRRLAEADLVTDIRGGDSFSDIYGLRGFVLGSLASATAILLEKPFVMLPQTIGPFHSTFAKRIARWTLRRAKLVFVRDQESREEVRALAGDLTTVRFSPDVAFTLESSRGVAEETLPWARTRRTSPVVGLNISALLYIGGYTQKNMFGLRFDYPKFVRRLIEALLGNSDVEIALIPHHYAKESPQHSDLHWCRKIAEDMASESRGRLRLVDGEYTAHELKGIIGTCDFFVGSRMHACIAALSQCVPAAGVAYSRKFKGVFESVGVGDLVVDARDLDVDTAVGRILTLYERRRELAERLQSVMTETRAHAVNGFRCVLDVSCD
jgi:polysaccharide pyruvyl transferase WcaK-like protein